MCWLHKSKIALPICPIGWIRKRNTTNTIMMKSFFQRSCAAFTTKPRFKSEPAGWWTEPIAWLPICSGILAVPMKPSNTQKSKASRSSILQSRNEIAHLILPCPMGIVKEKQEWKPWVTHISICPPAWRIPSGDRQRYCDGSAENQRRIRWSSTADLWSEKAVPVYYKSDGGQRWDSHDRRRTRRICPMPPVIPEAGWYGAPATLLPWTYGCGGLPQENQSDLTLAARNNPGRFLNLE